MKTLYLCFNRLRKAPLAFVAILYVGTALWVPGQEGTPMVSAAPAQKAKEGSTPESTGPDYAPGQPQSCESFAAYLDDGIIRAHKATGTFLIVVVRAGRGERGANINQSRLRQLDYYLKQRKVKYVLAEGARLKESGQVEIYVAGRLITIVPIKKNDQSVCSGKVNPFF